MEQDGIIKKLEISEWAAPTVPVQKKDGKYDCVCGLQSFYKPHLEVEQYPLPKPDDLLASLASGKKFTTLNLTHANQQMSLQDEDQQHLTVNTRK